MMCHLGNRRLARRQTGLGRGEEHSHHDGGTLARPVNADVVGAAMTACSRLAPELPGRRKACAQPVEIGLGVLQPLHQLLSTVARQGRAEHSLPEQLSHGPGAAGVSCIARFGLVEFGLPAVQSGDGVTQLPGKPGQAFGAAERAQQQVRSRVVTDGDGGMAQLTHRHARALSVFFGHGRPRQQRLAAKRDSTVQALQALVHPAQHLGGGQPLEGAAHGKALVEPVARPQPTSGVAHRHPQTPLGLALQGGPLGRIFWGMGRGPGLGAGHRASQAGERDQGQTVEGSSLHRVQSQFEGSRAGMLEKSMTQDKR